mgnify:CR=1 FL=1
MTARVPGVSAALETVQVPVVAFRVARVQSASGAPSTETVTVPVGVTVDEATRTVQVTDVPSVDGFVEEVIVVVVGAAVTLADAVPADPAPVICAGPSQVQMNLNIRETLVTHRGVTPQPRRK